jgi:hypothetical protein
MMATDDRVMDLLAPEPGKKEISPAEKLKQYVRKEGFSEKDKIELDDELVKTKANLNLGYDPYGLVKDVHRFLPLMLAYGGVVSGFAALVGAFNGGLMSKIASGIFGLLSVGLFRKYHDVTQSDSLLITHKALEIGNQIEELRGQLEQLFKQQLKEKKKENKK